MPSDFDYIVVGSGFGGSVAAHRLAEKGYSVAVMEMGRRWTAENLPRSNWLLRRWVWRPRFGLRGFFNIVPFRHVMILHGCAVGGGSITYANTLLQPRDSVWESGSWAGLAEWKSEMPGHYRTAIRMLGVVENHILGPADHLLRRGAASHGVGETYYRTRIAVFEPPEGQPGGITCPDPYFGGEGPDRATCIGCGGCMMGCRFNAKNTLDKNYLYLAEQRGAHVFEETRVVDVRPRNGRSDGGDGYTVTTERSTFLGGERRRFTCRGVVVAASALGTMDLLFRMKQKGALPALSDQLGKRVRTNAESLIGVRVPHCAEDLSEGVAIGSGVYLDEHTHIEATRYPAGSDAIGLLATILTGGRPGRARILRWLKNLFRALITRPWSTIRALTPFGFARETVILLCMQTVEGHIEMRLGRPWFWPFARMLQSKGKKVPTFIPQANEFAKTMAHITGGFPMSMVTEILFNVPGTAHVLGGCPMGASPADGVVDSRQRVFGYRNLYVCDGSVISANLGVNPSLTICAMTERVMSLIPRAEEARGSQA